MTMVIVDDNAKMRRYIRSAIADLAQDIHEGEDGAQAVALCARYAPEWLVIDVAMPVMDGIEAIRRIRLISPHSKAVVLTVFNDPEMRAAAREAGATAYLLKENLLDLRRLLADGAGVRDALKRIPQ